MTDSDVIVVTLKFFTMYELEEVPIEVNWRKRGRLHSKRVRGSLCLFDQEATGLKVWLIQQGVVKQRERIRCDLAGSLRIKHGDTIHVILSDRPIPIPPIRER